MFIADLHIHSRFSRATSPACEPVRLDYWARRKGLQLIASGDFTHAAYREELRQKLRPEGNGLYLLREEQRIAGAGVAQEQGEPRFIVSGEISSIYKHNGRARKIHSVILLPSLEAAAAISRRLEALGCNLRADGRPIIGLSAHDLLELTLDSCPDAIFIPAHIWTPHFSLFGAYSGYDSLEECFDDLSQEIHALETGLSSDPAMNRRLSKLDKYNLVSNSDAHSPANLAREANILACDLTYPALYRALQTSGSEELRGTIEFFPEEGKYHWDGHRNCRYSCPPEQTMAQGGVCPVCGGRLVVGVLHRVADLADRPPEGGCAPLRPYERLAPLAEVIASCYQATPAAKKVQQQYENMLRSLGPELHILREVSLDEITAAASPLIAEGVGRLRQARVQLAAGYDGEYGKVSLFTREELDELSGQTSLFAHFGYEEQAAVAPAIGPADIAATPAAAGATAATAEPAHPYGLNAAQWQAAAAPEREVAVLAGPGSGKTRTLICRVIHLLEQGVAPGNIMAVTFTNKAAGELKARMAAHFPDAKPLRDLKVGTFHALSLQLLRESGARLTLIDEYSALMLAEELLAEQGWKTSPAGFLKKLSRAKNQAAGPEMIAAGPEGAGQSLPDDAAPPPQLIELYQQKLAAYQAADYDDILLRALELAAGETGALPGIHLLVDEFQDINTLQLSLVEAWGRAAASLFVIGDPNQSIYGFRGADASCFSRFLSLHPQARRITLSENYRSTPQILACAQPLLAGEQPRFIARRERSLPVRLIEAEDAINESIFIAEEIDRLIGGIDMVKAHSGKTGGKHRDLRGLAEIAVLYRTHVQAEQIGHCLDVAGIPYTVAGREDFLTDPQVRLALAFFRSLTDSHDQLSRRLAARELGEERYARLAAEFAPRLAKEKAAALIDDWLATNYLDGQAALEKLRQAALLCASLTELLDRVLSGREGDLARSGGQEYAAEAVSLLTLHGAKGLEFPVVFVAGLKEGLIPFHAPGLTSDPAEEKRLLYVGMTRAEDELILIARPERSSLLSLIPPELLSVEQANRRRPRAKQLSLFGAEDISADSAN